MNRYTCPTCQTTWLAFPTSSCASTCFHCEAAGKKIKTYRGKEAK